jgi:triosephosphate isomerase
MRRPILAGNWKMYKSASQAQTFAELLLPQIDAGLLVDIVIAAPFTALDRLGRALGGSVVSLAAQNLNPEPEGAFTGEISASMLSELSCRYAIVGHSERRALYGETSEDVSRKARALQRVGIRPIVCVGESLEERDRGLTLEIVGAALEQSLSGVVAGDGSALVVAYEPVWAIGTGRNATPEIAQEVHAFIRKTLDKQFGPIAESIRIQYGGSVNPANAASLMAQPDIDGALVGGASLEPDSFAALINFVAQSAAQETA